MSDTIQLLVNQEVCKLKQAGYKKVVVSRTSHDATNNYFDIQLGNSSAIVERVTFDASKMLVNSSKMMLCLTSSVNTQEEQLMNVDLFNGFLGKINIKGWIHNEENHFPYGTEPVITPIKLHLIRITPLKN